MIMFNNPFFTDLHLRYAALSAIGILALAFAWGAFSFQGGAHFLVIHFSAEKGPDFLGTPQDVYVTIAEAGMAVLVNLALAHALYRRVRFLSYTIAYFSVFFVSLILIGVGVIISLN